MSGYCFDTDVVSTMVRARPPVHLIRRFGRTPAEQQFTTSITLAELLFGVRRRENVELERRIRASVVAGQTVLPFDEDAAEAYAPLRARLEREGRRLDEPDLRIASIALSRDLTLVTGNVRFARVADLRVENWLAGSD